MIKDIVTEQASTYVSSATIIPPNSPRASTSASINSLQEPLQREKAFSLARFIPLLQERIYVMNPFTRTYLVSWLTVLDSVPELELVTFLPDFLDGLLKFLGDPTVDIRTATQNVLADFLREIREVAEVRKVREEDGRRRRRSSATAGTTTGRSRRTSQSSESGKSTTDEKIGMEENGAHRSEEDDIDDDGNSFVDDGDEGEGSGVWIPGQGVIVDHGAIVEILLQHLAVPDEEIQSTCLRWIAEFLLFVQPTMVPFTPRLIPVILSSLAHHVTSIRTAANETNYNLYKVVQTLPDPTILSPDLVSPGSPTPGATTTLSGKQPELNMNIFKERLLSTSPPQSVPFPSIPFPSSTGTSRLPSQDRSSSSSIPHKSEPSLATLTSQFESMSTLNNLNHHRKQNHSIDYQSSNRPRSIDSIERLEEEGGASFDYGATVNALTLQFLNEQEETRVAALEWLLMLHEKAPKKVSLFFSSPPSLSIR